SPPLCAAGNRLSSSHLSPPAVFDTVSCRSTIRRCDWVEATATERALERPKNACFQQQQRPAAAPAPGFAATATFQQAVWFNRE
ncbi:unnamed protein product, partial [Ectocarpus sp. 12 AP-2014]